VEGFRQLLRAEECLDHLQGTDEISQNGKIIEDAKAFCLLRVLQSLQTQGAQGEILKVVELISDIRAMGGNGIVRRSGSGL
jgi:hypothetical protein